MKKVRNSSDLRTAYEMLDLLNQFRAFGRNDRVEKEIAQQKREIRAFQKKQEGGRIVKNYGIDGFIELLELPEFIRSKAEGIEYFEECVAIQAKPSVYDCTGQAFTSWYKVFERRGRFFAYHSVSFDV